VLLPTFGKAPHDRATVVRFVWLLTSTLTMTLAAWSWSIR
jgi:hypothetical protein